MVCVFGRGECWVGAIGRYWRGDERCWCFYYLRIIKIMYFEDSEAPLDQDVPLANKLVLGMSMAVILLFFAGLNSVIDAANTATMALMAPF